MSTFTKNAVRLALAGGVAMAAVLVPAAGAHADGGCIKGYLSDAYRVQCSKGAPDQFRAIARCYTASGTQYRTVYGPWRTPGNNVWSITTACRNTEDITSGTVQWRQG